ncbi:hypothetical protein BDZ91DRAFT_789687 [Kalaharituber pfeilii]|nr:hypothetical protein BDZ91DRAFT_789687 [Kalaharituber pfeilii]
MEFIKLLPMPSRPPAATPPTAAPTPSRKRKGKTQDAYAIKRQLSGEEARKIASATHPAPSATATPSPPTSGRHQGKLPSQDAAFKRHLRDKAPEPSTSRRTPQAATKPSPTTPDVSTKSGIVVHGIALRKNLDNVRRWLTADNKDLKKIVGIRWLRKKDTLIGEGKKTSSVVVYLEDQQDIDKVRLGGRWLKASQYEAERGRR